MQRIREVVGADLDADKQTKSQNNESLRLDEQQISRSDLDKKIQNQGNSQRIVEVEENSFKTLHRMYS